jgi:hypothetical protein
MNTSNLLKTENRELSPKTYAVCAFDLKHYLKHPPFYGLNRKHASVLIKSHGIHDSSTEHWWVKIMTRIPVPTIQKPEFPCVMV